MGSITDNLDVHPRVIPICMYRHDGDQYVGGTITVHKDGHISGVIFNDLLSILLHRNNPEFVLTPEAANEEQPTARHFNNKFDARYRAYETATKLVVGNNDRSVLPDQHLTHILQVADWLLGDVYVSTQKG